MDIATLGDVSLRKEGEGCGDWETHQPRRFAQLFKVDQSRFTNAIERHVANQPTKMSAWPADVKPGTLRTRRLLAVLGTSA